MDVGKYASYMPEQVEALERVYSECPKPSSMRRQQLIRECPILYNIEPKQIKVAAFGTHGLCVLNPSSVGILFPSSRQKRRITSAWLKLVKFLKLRRQCLILDCFEELVAEIFELEKQKDEVDIELKKITTHLTTALTRLHKSREERNQFDEASNQIVLHLKAKEDELSRSVASCKLEGDVVHAWINFLESTWVHQSAITELKEKHTNDELDRYEGCFMKLIKHHLLACKAAVGSSLTHIRTIVDNLKIFSNGYLMI